jgi:hypothetical protein
MGIPPKISLEQLREMLARIAADANWDMTRPLLWGYFFVSNFREPLEEARRKLEALGYRFVMIYLGEKDDPGDADTWWLHVEREEIHTPETLYERNGELEMLAAALGTVGYDGMDAGPLAGEEL